TDGTYDITAASHALQGKDLIAIAGGDFTLTATEDAIHAKNSDDTTLGDIEIDGGTFTITAGDDAIHAESDLVVNGGTIDILSCNEGLEGNTVTVTAGDISIVSSDDAINAAGESTSEFAEDTSAQIYIYGGTIDIECNGDAIDSNGSITMTGGYITISGPGNSGNGTLDYLGTASITGGTIVAASVSGMAMNFSEASQGSILITTSNQSEGSEITVTDASGNEILSYTPAMSYSCVLVSSPDIEKGSTYTITAGSTSTEVTVDDYITGSSQGMGMMGQMGDMGEMPSGEFPGGEMSGEMPSGEFPGGEMSGEMPSGEMPGGRGGQMPGGN
nr:carbohydrate-binding domain-containing protein [Saccharofermentans sp.]